MENKVGDKYLILLPPLLQESIKAMEASWAIIDSGGKDYNWDNVWCELNSDINVAEVEGMISPELAKYLREKYLRMIC